MSPSNSLLLQNLSTKIKRQQITDNTTLSLQVLDILRIYISKHKFLTLQKLIDELINVTIQISGLQRNPYNIIIHNICRRVLSIIRNEFNNINDANNISQQWSSSIKGEVIDEIGVLYDEIRSSDEHISEQSIEHIYSRDIILTYSYSNTVVEFLKQAHKLREFEVLVCQTESQYNGHKMVLSLTEHNIDCTLINDAAIFALMPVVNKIVAYAECVLADGTIITHSGGLNIATVAKHYNKPVIVLTAIHNISPLYTFNNHNNMYQTYGDANNLLPLDIINNINNNDNNHSKEKDNTITNNNSYITVTNPLYDIVKPEYITLFITNIGGQPTAYIYRLLTEYYHTVDYDLLSKLQNTQTIAT